MIAQTNKTDDPDFVVDFQIHHDKIRADVAETKAFEVAGQGMIAIFFIQRSIVDKIPDIGSNSCFRT